MESRAQEVDTGRICRTQGLSREGTGEWVRGRGGTGLQSCLEGQKHIVREIEMMDGRARAGGLGDSMRLRVS